MDNLGVLNHEEEGYKYLNKLGFSDIIYVSLLEII